MLRLVLQATEGLASIAEKIFLRQTDSQSSALPARTLVMTQREAIESIILVIPISL